MLNGLDLFSGIGGLSLALAPWVRPIAGCEIDEYAQGVLFSRMRDGSLPVFPIWDDVRTLRAHHLPRRNIDIIYGGFPCQDLSVAGTRAGLDGERSGLYREVIRLVSEIRPGYIFLENVPGIRRYAHRVVGELAQLGYDARWTTLSAAEVGAPHKRNRWWCLAANPKRLKLWLESGRIGGENGQGAAQPYFISQTIWRKTPPEFCGMDDGVPNRMDRLRGLGNAVVPAQARHAFEMLSGMGGA